MIPESALCICHTYKSIEHALPLTSGRVSYLRSEECDSGMQYHGCEAWNRPQMMVHVSVINPSDNQNGHNRHRPVLSSTSATSESDVYGHIKERVETKATSPWNSQFQDYLATKPQDSAFIRQKSRAGANIS